MEHGLIPIIAMRNWGELGNLLAAKTLARCLARHSEFQPEVHEAENFFPRFLEFGEEIRRIIKSPETVDTRRHGYLSLMDEVGQLFYPGFEDDERVAEPLARELDSLVDFLRQARPSTIIGTKEVISRLLMAAARQAELPVQVVNYITNEGLLRLQVHRSRSLEHHLVAFESGRRYLINDHDYLPHQVHAVGRLITPADEASIVENPDQSGGTIAKLGSTDFRVLIFSNRGGSAYLEPLRLIGSRNRDVSVLFIGYNDRQLVNEAKELQQHLGIEDMQVVEHLGHGEYVQSVRWLSEAKYPVLVSKTGPNTMLEAAYFGVPQLLLKSGLPAEDWVGRFVEEHGFGLGFEDMSALAVAFSKWLDDPGEIVRHRHSARQFAEGLLDPS
ncbi:MAG: hypothetical protein MPN21_23570 [Thermoanaerobaculia bacterium]|nr:hypothetical protein [Thermoanaerobaculia bacterium]